MMPIVLIIPVILNDGSGQRVDFVIIFGASLIKSHIIYCNAVVIIKFDRHSGDCGGG